MGKTGIFAKARIKSILLLFFIMVGITGIILGALITDGTFSGRDQKYLSQLEGMVNLNNQKEIFEALWSIYYLIEVAIGIAVVVISTITLLTSSIIFIGSCFAYKKQNSQDDKKVIKKLDETEEEKMLQKLERIHELYLKGALTETEYLKMKSDLFDFR